MRARIGQSRGRIFAPKSWKGATKARTHWRFRWRLMAMPQVEGKKRKKKLNEQWEEHLYGSEVTNPDGNPDDTDDRPEPWDRHDGATGAGRHGDGPADVTFCQFSGNPPKWEAVVTRQLGAVSLDLSERIRESVSAQR